MKVIEHGFDEIIKADLELTDTNEDLIKKGMFSRTYQEMTENDPRMTNSLVNMTRGDSIILTFDRLATRGHVISVVM